MSSQEEERTANLQLIVQRKPLFAFIFAVEKLYL